MSFNRGVKRDSFGNRGNFNRGGSGGSGNRVGNNMGNNNMGNNMSGGMSGGSGMGGMNPWEGGMMPGRGILPTPNNNLSLASPQAQLAIASNLLTNLLRSQQEVQPQVPSLMSLGNNYSGPGSNYPNQQNYSSGRFSDRPARHPIKNQRPQPYNKMGNRARDGPAGRRGPSAQQSRAPQSGSQRMNGNQIQHRNDKSSKPIPASKQNQTAKKEQQDVKTSDNEKAEPPVPKSDDADESEDKNRDWKDEKEEVCVKIEKTEDEKTEDTEKKVENPVTVEDFTTKETKEASEKTDKENTKTTGKKSEARHAESRYAEVPMSHMFCHICNKHMWDGFSFENHLRGRAHQLMMEKLDESYKLKVDLMRHELRVAEEQRELSLNNSKRRGKKVSVDFNVREYCTMCDLNFYGTLSTHRKSEKHQQLKTFLHPRCFPCLKEFPSRIEYDEHCLTPAHMKNAVQCEEQRKNKKKEKLAKGEAEVRTAEDEEKDVCHDTKNEKEEDLGEQEYITDITENINEKKFKVPSYKYCRQNQIFVGKSMVKEVQGFYCERCRRFMLLAEDMNAHLRSITHYRNFLAEVKLLTSNTAVTESKETEQIESEKNTVEVNEECDENRKRRKISHDENEDNDKSKELQENDADNANAAPKRSDGEEKYDPLEADAAESEEEENREAEEKVKEIIAENTANVQEKKTPVDEMWADIDNDNDVEMGNLVDDADEKEHAHDPHDHEKSIQKIDRNHSPQIKSRGRGYARGRGGPRARRSRR
ncbi:zinc finger protein on ecdysone puffs [Formica exsecta]|uniref:zinc finger protein on ecdysone puffs n=1 Tax=Formica exsecta TaxID=72781 RepID=UPI001141BF66|nr:zinc finger protein on ecdysone puffs [Formica exsecta]XP_029667462.1 zinc finger protein on ecdysone puffs [Formica exsecta]XP_029667463.1 zinc finger protein on ecdysone puffs [Formica exsecta]